MPGETLRCPLCGTILPKAEYEKVLKKHEGLRAHLQHLKTQAAQLKAEKTRLAQQQRHLKKQYTDFRRQQKLELRKALKAEGERVAKAVASQSRREAERALRKERREIRKQARDFRKVQSRLASYEKRMKSLADKAKGQNEEIRRLKEQIEKGTTPQIEGLLEEKTLLRYLRDLFPKDHFDHTGKGGDVLQTVLADGKRAGLIVYECKRVKEFRREYVFQASEARRKREADYAILVTNAFPAKNQFFFVSRQVLVISPAALAPLVHTARESLIRLFLLKASEAQKRRAVQEVYAYLAGAEYSAKIGNIAAEMLDLSKELKRELDFHKGNWKKRYRIYKSVFSDIGAIDARLRKLIAGAAPKDGVKLLPPAPKPSPYPPIPELEGAKP